MPNVQQTPFNLLPFEVRNDPKMGPLWEWVLRELEQIRLRTGGNFDQVEENSGWKFPLPPMKQEEDSPGPPLPPREPDEPPVIDVIGVAAARQAREAFDGIVPVGGIIAWSGSTGDIPDNWQICDGTNGTPDLQNRFIIGAGSTYSVDDSGGGTIAATAGGPSATTTVDNNADASTVAVASSAHDHTITVDPNLPPYYALAWIQRLQ